MKAPPVDSGGALSFTDMKKNKVKQPKRGASYVLNKGTKVFKDKKKEYNKKQCRNDK